MIVNTCYCDRCGEKIVGDRNFRIDTCFNTTIKILYDGEWMHADLCDKCNASFKAWWDKLPQAQQE